MNFLRIESTLVRDLDVCPRVESFLFSCQERPAVAVGVGSGARLVARLVPIKAPAIVVVGSWKLFGS